MMLLLLYVCAPLQKGAHIYTISVGCLFSSFISLVFGDTTYSMFLSKSFYEFNRLTRNFLGVTICSFL